MELGLILGRNLEKPGKRQNLGVFQGFSRSNFAFLPFSRFFQVFQVTWQPCVFFIENLQLQIFQILFRMLAITDDPYKIYKPSSNSLGCCESVIVVDSCFCTILGC